MQNYLMHGVELYKLIPQRPPIVQVDTLYSATETEAHTGLTVEATNYFCVDNQLQEPGLIEHIAQSAAAFAGYATYLKGEEPHLGFIGEVKKCKIYKLPNVGSQIHTHVELVSEIDGISLMRANTLCGEEKVADCQIKIFLKA